MFTDFSPKLPMHDTSTTREFYANHLGFSEFGSVDFDGYLMMEKDQIKIHFFEFKGLDPKENYGQVYIRTDNIDALNKLLLEKHTEIHPNGKLEIRPSRQKEFLVLDPGSNLLTFGQSI